MKYSIAVVIATGSLVLSDAGHLLAATYVEPSNEKVLFRTDQIPIDVDTINWLSAQLVVIASSKNIDSADQFRAKAQLLAISSQLNKNNKEAKNLNRKLNKDEPIDVAKVEDINRAKARVWSIIRFLEGKNAGSEANSLASYIKDALVILDPNHPSLKSHKEDSSAWANVVASLDKYEDETPPSPDKPKDRPRVTDEPDDYDTPEPKEESKPKTDTQLQAKWTASEASIQVEVEGYIEEDHKRRKFRERCHLSFKIKPGPQGSDDDRSKIKFDTQDRLEKDDHDSHLSKSVQSILKSSWPDIDHADISLKFSKSEGEFKVSPSLLNGICTTLNGVLAGKKIRSGLLVFGGINKNGIYYQRDNHWSVIQKLRKETSLSARILVPTKSAGDFRQYIALETPEFFVKNEVIGVKNLKDSQNYVGIEDEGDILTATLMFKEFQKVAKSRAVGPLMTNRHVRAKLEKIVEIMPNHISAKTLLLQGTATRATKLEPLYVAYELESRISVMRWLEDKEGDDIYHLDDKKIEKMTRQLENQLDEIQPYVDSAQKDLMADCRKIVFELKNLARAGSRDHDESDYHKRLAKKSYIGAMVTYRSLDKKLAAITKREIKK